MPPFEDSFSMTPDKRRAAIAKILAAGILRLHTQAAFPSAFASSSDPENNENPGCPRLEVPDETMLNVRNGYSYPDGITADGLIIPGFGFSLCAIALLASEVVRYFSNSQSTTE